MPLNELSDDELVRRKKMLDIAKFEQDLEQDRERHRQAQIEAERRYRLEHEASMARIEQMRIENDKFRTETLKLIKETKFYPWIVLLASMSGGLIVAALTRLF